MGAATETAADRLPSRVGGRRPARRNDGTPAAQVPRHLTEDELRALLRDGTPADVADVLLSLPEANRRALSMAVRRAGAHAAPDLAEQPEAALLIAGAACLPRADAIVSWLRSRRFHHEPSAATLADLLRVLTAPGRPRPASVAAVLADRMRPRPAWPGEWPILAALLHATGTPPPTTEAVLRAWIRGHAGDPDTLADRLAADPWLEHLLPHLFDTPGLDRAWPPALTRLAATGHLDRAQLLRRTLHRLRADGSPAALRPAATTHDLLAPTQAETAKHRRDYTALLDGPHAELARRALQSPPETKAPPRDRPAAEQPARTRPETKAPSRNRPAAEQPARTRPETPSDAQPPARPRKPTRSRAETPPDEQSPARTRKPGPSRADARPTGQTPTRTAKSAAAGTPPAAQIPTRTRKAEASRAETSPIAQTPVRTPKAVPGRTEPAKRAPIRVEAQQTANDHDLAETAGDPAAIPAGAGPAIDGPTSPPGTAGPDPTDPESKDLRPGVLGPADLGPTNAVPPRPGSASERTTDLGPASARSANPGSACARTTGPGPAGLGPTSAGPTAPGPASAGPAGLGPADAVAPVPAQQFVAPRFPAAPVSLPADGMPPPIATVAELVAELTVRLSQPLEPVGLERVLAAVVSLAHSDRDDLAAALVPLADAAPAPFDMLLGSLARPGRFADRAPSVVAPPAAMVPGRVRELARQLATVAPPALLATPTTTDGLVSPVRMLFRLIAAERDGWQPGPYDLAQALLRLPAAVDPTVQRAADRLVSPAGLQFAAWLRAGGLPPVTATVITTCRSAGAAGASTEAEPQRRATFLPPQAPTLPHDAQPEPTPAGVPPLLHDAAPAATVDSIVRDLMTPPDIHGASRPGISDMRCWPMVLPRHREVIAAHCLAAAHHGPDAAETLSALARADGPFGPAMALALAHGLTSPQDRRREAAVDAVLHLASGSGLDSGLLGRELRAMLTARTETASSETTANGPAEGGTPAQGAAVGGVVGWAADSLGRIGAGRAWHVVWAVSYAVVPALLRQRPIADGVADLLAVAADAAAAIGARADLPDVVVAAAEPWRSDVAVEAGRLARIIRRNA
ncbi:hypothetical protein [Paractinoplanes toevensis]|uniref:Uncharacterized protein n=1 Tax=Paractinoplanes toevensis TaxID=571911 RepID=A0A919WAM2_9ACTN|nr:hypothetical protein [Actinoplanes toevensis]GIM96578.1 hypothetical protein Ato02nite_083710 [Actinoplanes toevensis]